MDDQQVVNEYIQSINVIESSIFKKESVGCNFEDNMFKCLFIRNKVISETLFGTVGSDFPPIGDICELIPESVMYKGRQAAFPFIVHFKNEIKSSDIDTICSILSKAIEIDIPTHLFSIHDRIARMSDITFHINDIYNLTEIIDHELQNVITPFTIKKIQFGSKSISCVSMQILDTNLLFRNNIMEMNRNNIPKQYTHLHTQILPHDYSILNIRDKCNIESSITEYSDHTVDKMTGIVRCVTSGNRHIDVYSSNSPQEEKVFDESQGIYFPLQYKVRKQYDWANMDVCYDCTFDHNKIIDMINTSDILFNIGPCGSQKSFQTRIAILNLPYHLCTLATRVTFSRDATECLNKVSLDLGKNKNTVNYLDFQNNIYDILNEESIVVSLKFLSKMMDSCDKDGFWNYSFEQEQHKYILILDEVEEIFQFLSSSLLKGERSQIFNSFCRLVENAHKIIAMSADVSEHSIKYIHDIRRRKNKSTRMSYYEIKQTKKDKKVSFVSDKYDWMHLLLEDVKCGKRVGICCSQKKDVFEIEDFIKKEHHVKILTITGETSSDVIDNLYKNFDEYLVEENVSVLIFTTKLGSGFSINIEDYFHKIYQICSSNLSFNLSKQMLFRIRNIIDNEIIVTFTPKCFENPYKNDPLPTSKEIIREIYGGKKRFLNKNIQKYFAFDAFQYDEMNKLVMVDKILDDILLQNELERNIERNDYINGYMYHLLYHCKLILFSCNDSIMRLGRVIYNNKLSYMIEAKENSYNYDVSRIEKMHNYTFDSGEYDKMEKEKLRGKVSDTQKSMVADKCRVLGFYETDINGILPKPSYLNKRLLYDITIDQRYLESVFNLNKCLFTPMKLFSASSIENCICKYESYTHLKYMLEMMQFKCDTHSDTHLPLIFSNRSIFINDYDLCNNNQTSYLISIKDFLMKLYGRKKITISTICGAIYTKSYKVRHGVTIFDKILDNNICLVSKKTPLFVIPCIMNKIIHFLFDLSMTKNLKSIPISYEKDLIEKKNEINDLKSDTLSSYVDQLLQITNESVDTNSTLKKIQIHAFTLPLENIYRLLEVIMIQKQNYLRNADPDSVDSIYLFESQIDIIQSILSDVQHCYNNHTLTCDNHAPLLRRQKEIEKLKNRFKKRKKKKLKCFERESKRTKQ